MHREHSGHWPLHEIPRAKMRRAQFFSLGVLREAKDQVAEVHSTAHMSADHEGKAAEHRLLDNIRSPGQCLAHAGGERFIVSHGIMVSAA